jgi:hypothetical protein
MRVTVWAGTRMERGTWPLALKRNRELDSINGLQKGADAFK